MSYITVGRFKVLFCTKVFKIKTLFYVVDYTICRIKFKIEMLMNKLLEIEKSHPNSSGPAVKHPSTDAAVVGRPYMRCNDYGVRIVEVIGPSAFAFFVYTL